MAITISEFKERWRILGWSGVLSHMAYALLNRVFYFDHLCVLTLALPDTDPSFLQALSDFNSGFLPIPTMILYAKDKTYGLSADFLSTALRNRDACYAIWQKEELASYGWYATQPTPVTEDFKIHFPSEYVYMHRGYTNPAFRGQRLHAFGMGQALKHYTDQNYRGLISIVSGENIASLKSTQRLGYKTAGKIYLFACLGRYFVFRDRGTKSIQVWLSPLER